MTEIVVTARVSEETLKRIDALTEGPFKPKRSAVAREAIEKGLNVLEAERNPDMDTLEEYLDRAIGELLYATAAGGSAPSLSLLEDIIQRALKGPLHPQVAEDVRDVLTKLPKTKKNWNDIRTLDDDARGELSNALIAALRTVAHSGDYP